MLISAASFAAIDFESAGVTRGDTDAPVQIGMAVLEKGMIPAEWRFRSFLHTEKKITWSAQRVHGIRPDDLAGAPRLLDLWPRLNATLRGRVVVAHGMGTEKRFLRAFPMHGFAPWVDSLQVAQAVWPDLPEFSLEALAKLLQLEEKAQLECPGLTYHDALFDSVLSLLVLQRAVDDANLAEVPVEALCAPSRSQYFANRRWRKG